MMINQVVLTGAASEGLALGNMLYLLVAFLFLMWVLHKFAWGPVTKVMDERAQKVAHDLDDAEEARHSAQALEAEKQTQLGQARQQANAIIADAKAAGAQQQQTIVDDAHQAAEAMKQSAQAQIAQEKAEAMTEVKHDVAELSISIAEKILKRELNQTDQKALIDAYIEDLGEK